MSAGGFLGYDPTRVATLRHALAEALRDANVPFDDPLAASAAASWQRAVALMIPWEARLASILDCGFASPYQPVGPTGLPLDYLRPLVAGWTISTDPLTGPNPAIDLITRVDELVALLDRADLAFLMDHGSEILALMALIDRDEAARLELLSELGPDGFTALLAELTTAIVQQPIAAPEDMAGHLVVAFSAMLATAIGHQQVDADAYLHTLLDGPQGDPHVAALVLRDGTLPTAVLTSWTMAIVGRLGTDPSELDRLVVRPEALTAELLLGSLTADPEAGRRVLASLDDRGLAALLGPHLDGDTRGRFLVATADPATTAITVGLASVQTVLAWLSRHRELATSNAGGTSLHDWLGAYAGPYLLDLLPSAPARTSGAPLDTPATVAWIAESAAAAATLDTWITSHAHAGIADVMSLKPDGGPAETFAALGRQLGELSALVARGRLATVTVQHKGYADVVNLSKFLAGVVVSKGFGAVIHEHWSSGIAATAEPITTKAVDWVYEQAAAHHVLEPPPSREEARARLARQAETDDIGLAAGAASEEYRRLILDGRLRGDEEPPSTSACQTVAAYRAGLATWAAANPERRPVLVAVGALLDGLAAGRGAVKLS